MGGGQIPPEPPLIAAARLVGPVNYKWGQLTSNCTVFFLNLPLQLKKYLLLVTTAILNGGQGRRTQL